MKSVAVLAVDPGTQQSGYCLYRCGQILGSGVLANLHLRQHIETGGEELTEFGYNSPERVDLLAIEMIASYGMPVGREVFETAVWIGRFQQSWRRPGEVRRVPRLEVKLHLCHSARAKDRDIWQALVDRLGPVGSKAKPGPLYGVRSHARAALALALTVSDQIAAP